VLLVTLVAAFVLGFVTLILTIFAQGIPVKVILAHAPAIRTIIHFDYFPRQLASILLVESSHGAVSLVWVRSQHPLQAMRGIQLLPPRRL
jgi:hypothetical protein